MPPHLIMHDAGLPGHRGFTNLVKLLGQAMQLFWVKA